MNHETPIIGNAIDLLVSNHWREIRRRCDDLKAAIKHAQQENVVVQISPDYQSVRVWYQSEAKER